MARLAKIMTNDKRKALVARYADKREALKKQARDPGLSEGERQAARDALAKIPRNASPVRVRNRCVLTGRPRAVYRKFGLCRNAFRHHAQRGDLPGITKASR
jgi:small subunit ribosomal protein S14